MTEASKQRAKVYAESCDNESGGFLTHQLEKIREKAYLKGMQDPDAKKIFVGGIYWDAEKIEELIRNHTNQNVEAAKSLRVSLVLIEKLEAENKKLREVIGNVDMIFESLDSPDFMKRYEGRSIELAIHGHHMTWIKVKKALSSGVE